LIAFYKASQEGQLDKRFWKQNLTSGLVVGLVALPLAMAFAIASGARPEQGLYTAIVAGLLVSLFGGSRVQIAGPTGAFIVLLSGITARYGLSGLATATFLAGLILIAMGLLRIGNLIRYLPISVILGFTAGIGVVIAGGQLPAFLGLPSAHPWSQLQLWHPATTALGILSLVLVLAGGRTRVPGPLLALVVMTTLQSALPLAGVHTIGSAFGGIPQGLPQLEWLDLSWGRLQELFRPALAIACLGAIESLLSALVADGMLGSRHDPNQELIGQGLANLAAPLFGGFAATGAIARTATNVRNGGNSPLAGLFHCLTLLLILVALAPLAQNVPLTTLAAILLVVAWNMSEIPQVVALLRTAPRSEGAILLATFLFTIFSDLLTAVEVGVALSILDFLRKMTGTAQVSAQLDIASLPKDVQVYALQGPYFFAAAERFEQTLSEIQAHPRLLILCFQAVPFIDSTGLASLRRLSERLHHRHIQLVLSGLPLQVEQELQRCGLLDQIGRQHIFPNLESAVNFQLLTGPGVSNLANKLI